jgi:hypothetical protein
MGARCFNRWWLGTVLGLCALHVLLAVIADPYRVFGIVRYPKRNFEPNTRFLKLEFLRQRPEYDAFILGSSRAGYYEAEAARASCGPERRYFNLNASLENGAGIRQKVDWLAGTRRLRQVIINVDFDLQSVLGDPLDLLRQDHPLISGSAYTAFYAKYLLFQPGILYRYTRGQFLPAKPDPWDLGNGGLDGTLYATKPRVDFGRIFDTTIGAVVNDVAGRSDHQDRASAAGNDEFRRTVASLARAGVDRIVIVPPYRLDQYAGFSIDAYTEWMRTVTEDAGQIWDFSGYNAITADPENYVDQVHFNQRVGDRILQRACSHSDEAPRDGFGVRVTRENLDAHLAIHRRQHQEARAAIAGHHRFEAKTPDTVN